MSDHLTTIQIEGYGRRQLSGRELLAVSDHLGICETCSRRVERALRGDAAYLALRSAVFSETPEGVASAERAHLTFEQIVGMVDGVLAGEELPIVQDHLSCCEQCALAVNDLRAFRDQVAPEIDRKRPLPSVKSTTETRWRSLISALSAWWPKSPALVYGSALAALLMVATGWVAWQSLRGTGAGPELNVATSSTGPAPQALPESALVIARLNDGEGQVTLDQKGRLSGVDQLPADYQELVKGALTDQELERSPLLSGLSRPGRTLRGNGDDQAGQFSVLSPFGTVTLSDRPTFQWSKLDGATGYVVEVYDAQFDLAAVSPQVLEPSWTAPQSFKRGEIYYWQVKALKDGEEVIAPRPPVRQAKFRILDQTRADELTRARRAYASSHLTLGVLYARAGLLDDAEREFTALQKANPDSPVAGQLLRTVRAQSK